MYRLSVLTLAASLLAACFVVGQAPGAEQPEDLPRDVGLVEETRRQLVQLDVSVHGPAEAIENLTPKDFELTIGGRPIEQFYADRVCGGQPPPESLAGTPAFKPVEDSATPVVGVDGLEPTVAAAAFTFAGRVQRAEGAGRIGLGESRSASGAVEAAHILLRRNGIYFTRSE